MFNVRLWIYIVVVQTDGSAETYAREIEHYAREMEMQKKEERKPKALIALHQCYPNTPHVTNPPIKTAKAQKDQHKNLVKHAPKLVFHGNFDKEDAFRRIEDILEKPMVFYAIVGGGAPYNPNSSVMSVCQ